MRVIDLSYERPAENLALDEVLLDSLETGRAGETLRFWESASPFVVLGVSQVLRDEANEPACAELEVPILRRCTAGGCVLQGPGSLNYTLVLRYDGHPDIRGIRTSYRYILNRICEALGRRGIEARCAGTSDLVTGDLKFSGNAQRRRKHGILHHGTLLYGLDLSLLERCLREPGERPDYRGDRDHGRFVRNLPLGADELRAVVREAFGADSGVESPSAEEESKSRELAAGKYESRDWIHRR